MTPRPVHLLLLLAPLVACVKGNNASIEVFSICSPPAAADCKFSAKCDAQPGSEQIVDLSLISADSMILPVEVHNQLANNADANGHVNTNDAMVQQVKVSYGVPGFGVRSITTNLSQTVPATGTAVLALNLLNAGAVADFATGLGGAGSVEAIFDVKLKGVLADNSQFETGTYRVPVVVCIGCLASAYTCDTAGAVPTKFCIQEGQWPANWTCGAPPATFSIGGNIANLTTSNLEVTCNGVAQPIASGSASYSFSGLADGAAYVCTISTQPTGQTCSFDVPAVASGTISGADITNINITCAP